MDEHANDQPRRRRASAENGQPRATRGPRGPRANSAKGRLKALLEEAGPDGLTHAQITERLEDVAANTLATYLSVMSTSGELVRNGDFYRAGTPASAPENDDPENEEAEGAESDPADDEPAKAAE